MLGWFAFIPLDVFRLRVFPVPSSAVQLLGLLAVVGGLAIAYVSIGQNRFAAPTIHDQSAEAQEVIQSGLYGVVRHPFYAGMLLVYPGTALWLGSYAAAIGAIGFLVMTLARIVIEERYLREHLPEYGAYAARVRARLIPVLL
jgi:protein-S-isoprenylcysteine O-methyltransferase Ste14